MDCRIIKENEMKNIKNNITRILLFTSALATAQTPFEDDVVDVPAAPIDQWELPMFLIGTITVVYFIYKKAQQSKNV
jgi:hypothetical protein